MTEPIARQAAPPVGRRHERHVPDWVILALACTAQFMVVLDVSIVNVALPSIGRDLHYSPTGLQWVVNAYVLTFAGFLLLGGRAADLFGRRRVFIAGLVLFSAASLAGGFAVNSTWLTAARAVQGLGGAVLSPATLTIIVTTYTGAKVPRALGVWSAVAGAGGAAGAVLGGVLTAELSWRWVLFVNVPIGAAATIAALAFLTESRRRQPGRGRLDVAGALTVTAGLATAIYAIVGTDTSPWTSSRTLGTLAAAAVLLGAFALIERRATNPLMPFGLFRSRGVSGSNLVMLLVGAAFFSMWYFLSLYLQNVLGYGALKAGMAFLPMAVAIIAGAQGSSRLVTRLGVRPLLLAGTLLAAAGFAWLSRIGPHSGYPDHILGPGCLISFALGVLFTPLATAATAGVPPAEAGLASGVLNTSRQVGGSLGLAVLATIAVDRTRSLAPHAMVAGAGPLTAGYRRAFEVAVGLGLASFVAAFVVPVTGRRHGTAPGAAAGGHSATSGAPREDPDQVALSPERVTDVLARRRAVPPLLVATVVVLAAAAALAATGRPGATGRRRAGATGSASGRVAPVLQVLGPAQPSHQRPGSQSLAAAAARRLVASIPVGPRWSPTTPPPGAAAKAVGDGGAIPGGTPSGVGVDAAEYFTVPEPSTVVTDFATAHPPPACRRPRAGCSGSRAFQGSAATVSWTLAARGTAVVDQRISTTVTPLDARSSDVRLDGFAQWAVGPVPDQRRGPLLHLSTSGPCPAGRKDANDVKNSGPGLSTRLLDGLPDSTLVCSYSGSMGPGAFGDLAAQVRLGPSASRRLAKLVDRISTAAVPGLVLHCPAAFGSVAVLAFALAGRRTVDLWYAAGGCPILDNGRIIATVGDNPSFGPFAAALEGLANRH